MGDFKNKIALVVDDEPAQLEYVSAILDDHRMNTISASNGIEAMDKIKETKPDVIILDIMMPGQSGLKFFHNLEMKKEYNDIPVIIVSGASSVTGVDFKSIIYDKSFADRKKKVFGVDAAPNAFLEKPVEPEELIETISKFIDG